MTRAHPIIASFNAGEWSRDLWSRVDLAKYPSAARRLENMIPRPQGPIARRPGTRYIADAKAGTPVLIPFEFSTEQAYVIEASAGSFRFFKDGGGVLSGGPGSAPYEITNPYTAAELPRLRWCQSADVLYLVSPERAPMTLSRTGHTAWTLTAFDPQDGPYLELNATATTLTPSATAGTITLTASAAVFTATDVGRPVRLKHTLKWGWCKITAVTSATVATAEVKVTFGGIAATKDWRLGAWSAATGWPRCVLFHEDRLTFAATATKPQTLWGSASGGYDDFAPTDADAKVTDDMAFSFTTSDNQVNSIRWLAPGDALVQGTASGQFSVRGKQSDALGAASLPVIRRATTIGAADAAPLRIGNTVLFIDRSRRRLIELAYNWEDEAYVAPALSLLASHLTRGLAQIVYQDMPWSLVWARTDGGALVAMTYLRDQDVVGWHRHPLGGRNVKVLGMTVIPGDGRDELWLLVERSVGAGTRRTLEVLDPDFEPAEPDLMDRAAPPPAATDGYFVDCGLTYRGAAVTAISGLSHLEGETVQVVADGAAHPDRLVSGGAITLQSAASTVHVGLAAVARYVSMGLEAGATDGTAQGKKKRVDRVVVKLRHALGCRIGPLGGDLDDLPFRFDGADGNKAPPLYSGDREVIFGQSWTTDACLVVEQRQPLPLEVTALIPRVTTIEG